MHRRDSDGQIPRPLVREIFLMVMADSSTVENERDAPGRVGKARSEKRTPPKGLSDGLLGGDLLGSIDGGFMFMDLVGCVGEGGV